MWGVISQAPLAILADEATQTPGSDLTKARH
jgi:hypothetical protein